MIRRLRLATLLALVAVLAACTALPTSGPVVESDVTVGDVGGIDQLPEGPQPGASPTDIVESFLLAGASGFQGNFVTAREFLAGDARQTWKPLDGVVVAGQYTFTQTSKTQVSVDATVLGRVDGDGRYTEAPPDSRESVNYDLVRDDAGEWRISGLPDGLILTEGVFSNQFRSTTVYFASADHKFLVPETRWFPTPVNQLPTHVVKALLAGPSPWLRDAVTTAVPDGVTLNPEVVVVDDSGVAQVNLGPTQTVLAADGGLLVAQIEASLLRLPGVGSVQVSSGGVILDSPDTLEQGNAPSGTIEFLQADRLVSLTANTVAPVSGVGSLDGLGLRWPARDESGSVRVGISHGSSLVTLPVEGKASTTVLEGKDLVAPSVDRFGWAWTATSGGLVAGRAGAEPVKIVAPFLDGRTVRAVRVARDGTRIAVVSEGQDGSTVMVGAVVRDAKGAPQQIGDVIQAGAAVTDVTTVVWSDESTLAVIGRRSGTEAVQTVPVSGPSAALPAVTDLDGLAGGPTLYVTTTGATGVLQRYAGFAWTSVPGVTEALDPSYPG